MAPKVSKSEKAALKLDCAARDLQLSPAHFLPFMHRTNRWFVLRWGDVAALCKQADTFDTASVQYSVFKQVLLELGFHGNATEQHLLCLLLDPEQTERIYYENVLHTLWKFKEDVDFARGSSAALNLTPSCHEISVFPADRCFGSDLVVWDSDEPEKEAPCYLLVQFRMATFDSYAAHPGHFEALVRGQARVMALLALVRRHTQTAAQGLVLFSERTQPARSVLGQAATLASCGFAGGTRTHPVRLILYYDYVPEFNDCSLLMCDHFMANPPTPNTASSF